MKLSTSPRPSRLWLCLSTLLLPASAAIAGFPSPTYPECAEDGTLDHCPPDMLNEDGSWRGITWSFVSLIPPGLEHQIRPEERELGSGNWIDKAFQLTVGRYDVPIAVVDCGIRWRSEELTPKVLLNRGELPAPQRADGSSCANFDCNGDGWFTVDDYANDRRIDITRGSDDADGRLEPSDLIVTFSNGVDEDANGYTDDIAGWDFMWNDNDPKASNDFGHGTGVLSDAGATAGDVGSDMGYCPNCAVLPVRVSDSFIGEGNKIAQGIIYAADRGAKVIGCAMGGVTNSEFLRDAIEYAHSKGALVISAIGDELTYHHLPPGLNDYAMAVHSIEFFPIYGLDYARSFLAYNGCNNYGAHLQLVSATNDCATGAVATISGVAGLVYSRGLDNGLELSADEVRAMLTGSATDIDVPESQRPGSPYFPSYPGWDQFFGYGRVNARHAVDLAEPGLVPPEVYVSAPRWYAYIDPRETPEIQIEGHMAAPRTDSYTYRLEWAPGADARDSAFTIVSTGQGTASRDGLIFSWPVASIPRDKLDPAQPLEAISGSDPLVDKLEMVNAYTITLRLTVQDDLGNKAEHRKTFFLREDPDLLSGFPKDLGPGDSSPSLYDLNADGTLDVIVGTSDGTIHALTGAGAELPGWPVRVGNMPGTDPASPDGHSSAQPYALDGIIPARQGVLGGVTPTDLEQDGTAEVLVSTLDGWLYVFTADGKLKPGFPVTRDPIGDEDTNETHTFDPGMAASPIPADLDGDGKLEIVLPAMDQQLYVWRYDGSRQPGFPVLLATADSEESHTVGRIYSTPAIGDINGDGTLEIVLGSSEFNSDLPFLTFVYAVQQDGELNADGPIVPGWPVTVLGLLSDVVPFMGDGVTTTPVLLDLDDDGVMEIAVSPTGWAPVVLDGFGRVRAEMACDPSGWGANSDTREIGALPYIANLATGDINGDGHPDLVAGLTAANWALSLLLNRWIPYQDHLVVAWDARTGQAFDAWPRVIEDIAMFVTPAIADVSGDGRPEVIMSSGGYVVHAWDVDGLEPEGWPRFTGGWVYTAIRVGDIDGDGLDEVVAMTREGYLWAWHTEGSSTADRAGRHPLRRQAASTATAPLVPAGHTAGSHPSLISRAEGRAHPSSAANRGR